MAWCMKETAPSDEETMDKKRHFVSQVYAYMEPRYRRMCFIVGVMLDMQAYFRRVRTSPPSPRQVWWMDSEAAVMTTSREIQNTRFKVARNCHFSAEIYPALNINRNSFMFEMLKNMTLQKTTKLIEFVLC